MSAELAFIASTGRHRALVRLAVARPSRSLALGERQAPVALRHGRPAPPVSSVHGPHHVAPLAELEPLDGDVAVVLGVRVEQLEPLFISELQRLGDPPHVRRSERARTVFRAPEVAVVDLGDGAEVLQRAFAAVLAQERGEARQLRGLAARPAVS